MFPQKLLSTFFLRFPVCVIYYYLVVNIVGSIVVLRLEEYRFLTQASHAREAGIQHSITVVVPCWTTVVGLLSSSNSTARVA